MKMLGLEEERKIIFSYIEENIEGVLKEPVGFIRFPFTDPGSVYDGNVWDWDTYWCTYGLLPIRNKLKGGSLAEKIIDHCKGNVFNFFDWQLDDGYIPMMIENGRWPEPYLNIQHKKGYLMNMHKPFLCQQINLISTETGDYDWISEYLNKIDKYFDCYFNNYFDYDCGLFVWRDDIMIGMDNDPASFGRPKSSTANIFLNSFMVAELEAAATIYEKFGKDEKASFLRKDKNSLEEAIHRECFDKRDEFFYSVDVDICTRKYDWFHKGLGVFWNTLPIRIATWSGFLPMLVNIATKEEAESLRTHYHDEKAFTSAYGICTLGKNEKMFNIEATNNPSNWLGPVWLVANYCIFKGMLNYGYTEEAEDMCKKSVKLLAKDIKDSGQMHEYYNPFNGEPVMNGGFINWNILALNMLDEMNKD
ncbi:MAG: trehalase / alfa-L-rhamnosidase / mannosyl oligosaccharide glucosidase [Butyrivibrio sp.]|uniref:MGH1-like glycoside hydrolase domain-containing protein n=1 Tax=Butyrivibrio sp. TaxID=28121 RepID=UPI001B145A8E|nr:trehalase family glycosidase [Butyrivibrio sp.]MBO6239718.1 trehalase / alfa-L-rhamnosidase / mannosyl oligosaccharide glucosidase [Butyrivibrio sp.]